MKIITVPLKGWVSKRGIRQILYCCDLAHEFFASSVNSIRYDGVSILDETIRYCPFCGTRIIVEEKNKV